MNRRARQRAGKAGVPWLRRMAVVFWLAAAVSAWVLLWGFHSYLHGESFRRLLAREVGAALGGRAEFADLRWKGMMAHTDFFTWEGAGSRSRLHADGLSTEVGLGGWSRGVWEFRQARIHRFKAVVDLTQGTDEESALAAGGWPRERGRPPTRGWLPVSVECQDLEVGAVYLDALTSSGKVSVSGMRCKVEKAPAASSYHGLLEGGTVRLPVPGLPPLAWKEARVRWQKDSLFLTSLAAEAWGRALLTASGEWDRSSRRATGEGSLNNIPSERVLTGDWAKRVQGTVDIGFAGEVAAGSYQAQGDLRITDGVLTALPVLDVLAAYADTTRFRVVPLHQAHARWAVKNGVWRFSDMVLHSEGLLRLEGGFSVQGEDLDGSFRLGVAPGTLAALPGAERHVFLPGEHGLVWTTLRLSGTWDDPREDLSERLLAAAGVRLLEQWPENGERVIRHSQRVVGEAVPDVLEKGIRVLETGQGAVLEAGGILNRLLGAPSSPADPASGRTKEPR